LREQGTNGYSSRKKKKKKKKKKNPKPRFFFSERERESSLLFAYFFSCISFLVGWGKSVLSFGSEVYTEILRNQGIAFPSARLSETSK